MPAASCSAGEGIDADGLSVFDAEPPSDEWARELHGFGWLRHLRATDMAISRSNARSLVDEWIRLPAAHDPVAWEPDVVARRVIAWLAQTPLILEGCDLAFYRRFMKSLTRQVRYLRRTAYDGVPGLPRLRVMIALAAAALSMSDQPRFLKQASRWLDLELVRQVLPDGGHVSRNPAAILETPHGPPAAPPGLRRARRATVAHPALGDRPDDADAPLLPAGRRQLRPFQRLRRHRPSTSSPPCSPMTTSRGAPLANAPHQRLPARRGRRDRRPRRRRASAADRFLGQRPCRLPVLRDERRPPAADHQLRRAHPRQQRRCSAWRGPPRRIRR